MSAEVFNFDNAFLQVGRLSYPTDYAPASLTYSSQEISRAICNQVDGVSRVVYDL